MTCAIGPSVERTIGNMSVVSRVSITLVFSLPRHTARAVADARSPAKSAMVAAIREVRRLGAGFGRPPRTERLGPA